MLQPLTQFPQVTQSLQTRRRVLMATQQFYLARFRAHVTIESVNQAPVRAQIMRAKWGHVIHVRVTAASVGRLRALARENKSI